MSYARQMLDTYPRTFNVDAGLLAAAIDALDDCAQAAETRVELAWRLVVAAEFGTDRVWVGVAGA